LFIQAEDDDEDGDEDEDNELEVEDMSGHFSSRLLLADGGSSEV
jgi:hypothetical protein